MKPALWLALAVSLAAAAYVSTQGDDAVEPVTKGATQGAAQNGRTSSPSGQGAVRRGGSPSDVDLSARASVQLVQAVSVWQASLLRPAQASFQAAWSSQQPPPPPPHEPSPPPPPPPPMAPPFPHAWVGRYVDDHPRAIIAGPSTTWVVKAGDVIDGQWRVDRIQDRQLQMTYLPLQQTLTVAMK